MNQLTFTISASLAFAASSLVTCVLHAQDGTTTEPALKQGQVVESPSVANQSRDAKHKLDAMKSDAETNYIASPYNIAQLGMRSQWQTKIPHTGTNPFAGLSLEGNQIFAWDHFGVVTRIKSDTGAVLWQGSTQSKLDKIFSVNILPEGNNPTAIALTDASTIVFEDGSGALLAQDPLRRVPATAGAVSGNFIVFGDTEGRVIWLKLKESNIANVAKNQGKPGDYSASKEHTQRRTVLCLEEFGAMSKGKVATVPFVIPKVGILTVSTGGEICLFNATTSKQIWKYKSNAPFVSLPSVLNGVAYVAGKDQYLHAIDLQSGNAIWNWFTQVQLVNPPLAVGNLVALQVPEEGLVALSTNPADKISGLVMWKSKAAGNPLTLTNEGLITWDDASRTMTLVETKAGGITATATFPSARWVASTAPVDGTIMLLCDDGRLQQVRPIEMMTPVTPSKATEVLPAKSKDANAGTKVAKPSEEPVAGDAASSESAP
ncbi:MAG: hypothetical protein EXS12_08450 [Phycisphaerales bacterium]|nr:hypothetical protein [Phycisphaerales bacterium]